MQESDRQSGDVPEDWRQNSKPVEDWAQHLIVIRNSLDPLKWALNHQHYGNAQVCWIRMANALAELEATDGRKTMGA